MPPRMMNEGDEMEIRPGACNPIDNLALKKLCHLLRNNADTVLNGKASFTLTTEVLNRLNGDFRRHSITLTENEQRPPSACEINSWRPLRRVLSNLKKSDQKKEKEKEGWMSDIQFIKDFMLSTPTLKIIHKHRTLSFPISLTRFGNLSMLEIRKVPVHLIEGLQTIRGTLGSLTIVRSVSNLKGLLESCGGDRSGPLTWAKLKFLSLIFNEIQHLDDSLRWVSHLQSLDLSHNQIDDTEKFLENLVDVSMMNLAYNRMASIPSFSLTTRSSLTSLYVRGNHLDNIRGMECLISLEVLDVGENYLVDHSALMPVKGLHHLRKLLLDMNPLFYHKRHRKLSVCYLSPRAVGAQFLLDNKKLSGSEIGAYNPHVALRTSPRLGLDTGINERPSSLFPFSDNLQRPVLSSSGGASVNVNSSDIIATSTPKKGGKRKKIKVRNTEIRDLDTSGGDLTSSVDATPKGSPAVRNLERQMREKREEALRTQREVEKLREDYGSNWLQAIQDRNIFQQPSKSTASESVTETDKSDDGKGAKLKKRTTSSPVPESANNGAQQRHEEVEEAEIVPERKEDTRKNEIDKAYNSNTEDLKKPTDDDLYLTDTNISPVNNPIMAAIAKLASGQTENVEGGGEGGKDKTSSSSTSSSSRAADKIPSFVSSPLERSGEYRNSKEKDSSSCIVKNHGQNDRSIEVMAARKKLDFDGYDSKTNSGVYDTSNIVVESNINDDDDVVCTEKRRSRVKSSGRGGVVAGGEIEASKMSEDLASHVSKNNNGSNYSTRKSSATEEKTDSGGRDRGVVGLERVEKKKTTVDVVTTPTVNRSTDRSTSEMDSSTDTSLQILEGERESEPIIVTLPEANDATILVTTTELFIVEKDLNGKVKEKLDIRCLVSMTTKKVAKRRQHSGTIIDGPGERDAEEDRGSIPCMKMVLKFSYVRKDRRKRYYLLESQEAENLRKHLQPFLDAKEEEEKRKKSVIMQCLKCNRSFKKKDVVHRSKALPTSGSTKDLKVLKELMETPTLICPGCGSTILIEVESTTTMPSNKMRSSGSTASTSHSQGSHSSNGSSTLESWHMLQQLQQQPQQLPPQQQQQQQSLPPRKPAPMLRNRSFDHYSAKASLAARVARTRNASQTSADGLPVLRRPNLTAMSHQSQSPTDTVIEGRDRSNAFTAAGQTAKLNERPSSSASEKEEILHIEDHFASMDGTSVGSPNKELAKMTMSLRGDYDVERRKSSSSSSSRTGEGRTGSVGEKEKDDELENNKDNDERRLMGQQQPQQHHQWQIDNESQHSQNKMVDSGFESGVYSSGLGGEHSQQSTHRATHQEENSSNPHQGVCKNHGSIQNMEKRVGSGGSLNGKSVADGGERKKTEQSREKCGSDSKVVVATSKNKHKSLATMADLVNSLVSEGKDLEEKEMQRQAEVESVHSFYSDDGRKSTISVSELKRFFPVVSSPVHRTSAGSVDSDIMPLRTSPSGSSIAVLHNVQEKDNDGDDGIAVFNNGGSRTDGGSGCYGSTPKAAKFTVGSLENSYEELSPYALPMKNEGVGGGRRIEEVSSPLNSSICSSMVSSVYENVVAADKVGGVDGNRSPHHAALAPKSSVDSAGSEIVTLKEGDDDSDEVDEEEDIPSIYDLSKNPKTMIRHKAKTSATTTPRSKYDDDGFTGYSDPRVSDSRLYADNERAEEEAVEDGKARTSSYSEILDRISLGGAGAQGYSHGQGQIVVQSQGHSIVLHPKLGRQSSYSEQLYADPDLLERSYASPTLGGLIKEPTAADYYGDENGDDYEFDDEDAVDAHRDEDEEETYKYGAETSEVTYRFDRLDHRLTLYLMMTLFENHEEFLCKMSSECVGYMMDEAFEGLLVMSSCRFYILKVTDHDTSQEPDKWLACMEVQPIPELRYIDMGLGGQSLRLEFVTDCSSYTLVTRNRNKTLQFVEVLHNNLAHYAVSQGITSNLVVNEDVDQATLDNLNADVVSKVTPDQPLLLYVMGFIERGHYKKFPVSFVVSPSEVCLVRANHQWPQPRLQAPITVETSGKQFTILERQKINNVASLEVCEMTLKRIRLELFNETEGVSTIWNITMATKQSTYDFIHAISEPWAKEFGVDMDISYSVLDFGKS